MDASQSGKRRDFSGFDSMSTETLRGLLRQDFLLPEEESDAEAILYIAELLAKRDGPDDEAAMEAAWESFNGNYRGNAGGLYDDGPTETDSGNAPADGRSAKPRRRPLLRVLSAAAILVFIIALGTVVSYARGYDLFGAVAMWTGETFGFRDPDTGPLEEIMQYSDELSDLMTEFALRDMPFDPIPRYMPDGYECTDTRVVEGLGFTDFLCILTKGDSKIILQYRYHETEGFYNEVEKDDSPPEIYESHGTEYYIVTNMGRYTALWNSGDLECGIYMVQTHEEMIRILDSIGY